MSSIVDRYSDAAAHADILSKLAALAITVVAIVELFNVVRAAMGAESVSPDAVRIGLTSPIIYLLFFGIRLIWLFVGSSLVGRVLTWWGAVAAVFLDVQLTGGPASGVMYSLFSVFPLLVSGMTFVAAGTIKFMVTMLFVLMTNHGKHTDS